MSIPDFKKEILWFQLGSAQVYTEHSQMCLCDRAKNLSVRGQPHFTG